MQPDLTREPGRAENILNESRSVSENGDGN